VARARATHPNDPRPEETFMHGKTRDRLQSGPIGLLTRRQSWVAWTRVDARGEVPDASHLVPGKGKASQLSQVKPPVVRAFKRPVIEVEPIDVYLNRRADSALSQYDLRESRKPPAVRKTRKPPAGGFRPGRRIEPGG